MVVRADINISALDCDVLAVDLVDDAVDELTGQGVRGGSTRVGDEETHRGKASENISSPVMTSS